MTMLMMTQRTDHGTGPLTRKLRNLLLSARRPAYEYVSH